AGGPRFAQGRRHCAVQGQRQAILSSGEGDPGQALSDRQQPGPDQRLGRREQRLRQMNEDRVKEANVLWKFVERKTGGAGGVKQRSARQREWDRQYGEGNWAVGYVID